MTAYIEFNNKRSIDFDLYIINDLEHISTHNDIEEIVVPGRDGVLLKDNKRLVPVEKSIPFRMKGSRRLTDLQTGISDWLNVKGWHNLILSWDNDYIYKASVYNKFSITEVLKNFGALKVDFTLHPIKYLKEGLKSVDLVKGITLSNLGNVKSKPIIMIKGSGNGVISINGRETTLENVQGTLVIDMEKNIVYSGNLPAWDKIVRSDNGSMPYFDLGDNTISWTGDFQLSVIPNWGVKI